jgi:hypothetical protein
LKDEEKAGTEKIRNAIVTAFEKYAKRYNERYFLKLKSAPPEEKKQLMQTYKKVDSLLSKRVFIPGFYRYVLRKVIESKQLMRQRTTFIKASLISIFNQKGVKVGNVIEKPVQEQFLGDKELPEAYTRRHTQRFFYDYWPDAFFKMNDSLDARVVDDRFMPFYSVFAPPEPPRTETSDIADQVLSASDMIMRSNAYLQEWLQSSSALDFILPEFLDDMRSFMGECRTVIAQEKKRMPKTYSRFISSELNRFSPLFEIFYKHVTSIFAWKWFLLQNPQYRQWMLDEAFPLEYSASDATKAREILLSLTSERETKFFLSTGAIELVERAQVFLFQT